MARLTRFFAGPREADDGGRPSAPLGGTRREALQRLQIGIGGLAAMGLLVGLASILGARVDQSEADALGEGEAVVIEEEPTPSTDPLVDAGVVPDLPADPAEDAIEGEGLPPPQTPTATPDAGDR